MNLRNYTSRVPVDRSIAAIETLLVQAGAGHISKFYEDQRCAGFMFQINIDHQPISFKLTSDPLAVRRIMEAEVKRAHRDTMKRVAEQAERTAWAILQLAVERRFAPMTEDEKRIAGALGMCSFLPGSSEKRFARNISSIAENSAEITEPQRKYLYLLAIKMRRQISKDVTGLIPEEWWKQYEESKFLRRKRRHGV